jgi:hypothetical protein
MKDKDDDELEQIIYKQEQWNPESLLGGGKAAGAMKGAGGAMSADSGIGGAVSGGMAGGPAGAVAGAALGIARGFAAQKKKKRELKAQSIKEQAAIQTDTASKKNKAIDRIMEGLRAAFIFQ